MTQKDRLKQLKKEFEGKDGIDMRLWVDLMIANQNDKELVKKKLDELWQFIKKASKEGKKEGEKDE